jgi:hypothetical protein
LNITRLVLGASVRIEGVVSRVVLKIGVLATCGLALAESIAEGINGVVTVPPMAGASWVGATEVDGKTVFDLDADGVVDRTSGIR